MIAVLTGRETTFFADSDPTPARHLGAPSASHLLPRAAWGSKQVGDLHLPRNSIDSIIYYHYIYKYIGVDPNLPKAKVGSMFTQVGAWNASESFWRRLSAQLQAVHNNVSTLCFGVGIWSIKGCDVIICHLESRGHNMIYPLINKHYIDPENHQFLMETCLPTPICQGLC